MSRKPLSQKQIDTLRIVAAGKCTNPFYGNSNVDNRSLGGLVDRGLVAMLNDPWRVEATDAGRALLAS